MVAGMPDNLIWPERRGPRAHYLVVDTLIAAALVVVNVAIGFSSRVAVDSIESATPTRWWHWALLVAPPLGLTLRRRFPLGALGFIVAANAVVWGSGLPEFGVSITIALYSAVVFGRAPWNLRVPVALGIAMFLFTLSGWLAGSVEFYALPVVAVLMGGAIIAALNTATRHAYFAEVEQRAVQAERQREADEYHVVSQERARIARELHDVVAHGLSLIVVQAGAAQRVIDRDPEAASEALHQIEEAARSSLGEMRHVLGVLRSSDADERRPTPTLAALEPLFETYRRSGLTVSAELGEGFDRLPLTVDLGTYRIVEEALTNTFKHAGPNAEAHVRLLVEGGRLLVEILDNGRGGSAAGPTSGAGHGLRGMSERIAVLGGSLRTGPRPGGGYEVRAEIPLHPGRAGIGTTTSDGGVRDEAEVTAS